MRRERLLIVDSNPAAASRLGESLRERGYETAEAGTLEAAAALLGRFEPTLALVDLAAPGCERAGLVERLPGLAETGLVVSAAAPEAAAARAREPGIDAFLPRPLELEPLLATLERVAERRALRAELAGLRTRVRTKLALIGSSPDLLAVFELVRRVAPTKATILVHAESGAGKHHLAQVVHELSPRRDKPFVTVNCAALSEGLVGSYLFGHEQGAAGDADRRRIGRVERAHGGTLYLHEVGQLPPAVQVQLVRMLQDGAFERLGGRQSIAADVRVVAGSQRDLAEEVRAGRFRDDLYYRLNVVSVALPPLRSRKADIPSLVGHLLAQRPRPGERPPLGVTPGVLSTLFAYPWPGNLRELARVVDEAASRATGPELQVDDLPAVVRGARAEDDAGHGLIPGATLFEIEREAILRTLEQAGGSTARAAEVLGVSVRKVQYRLKEYRAGQTGRRHLAQVVAFGAGGVRR
jgi:two-component system NtrC family response regulator